MTFQPVTFAPLRFGSVAPVSLPPVKPKKVAIVGAGNVGASAAAALVQQNACNEVALFDIAGSVAEGKALDLTQAAAAAGSNTKVTGSSDYAVIKDADIVVVTAGRRRKDGETRSDMLAGAAKVIADVCDNIKKQAPNAKIIMVSNPLDAMAHLAQKVTGFAANRVLGMAGVLDTARMRTALALKLAEKLKGTADVRLQDVKNALVIGEHGDAMVALPQRATLYGKPVTDYLTPEELADVTQQTVKGGSKLIELLKPINSASSFGPGAAIAKMIGAILGDTKETLPCSVQLNGEFGETGIYAGAPAVLGAQGVEKVESFSLTPEEQAAWQKSVASIKANIAIVDSLQAQPAQPVAAPQPETAQPPVA